MTKHEKWELAGIAVAVLIVLYLLFRKRVTVSDTPAQATDYGPWYLAYNVPKGNLPVVGPSASQNTNPNLPSCGCSDQTFFGSTNQFTQYLTSKMEGIADSYTQNVMSVLPPFLKDVFNNPTAVQAAERANTVFA